MLDLDVFFLYWCCLNVNLEKQKYCNNIKLILLTGKFGRYCCKKKKNKNIYIYNRTTIIILKITNCYNIKKN